MLTQGRLPPWIWQLMPNPDPTIRNHDILEHTYFTCPILLSLCLLSPQIPVLLWEDRNLMWSSAILAQLPQYAMYCIECVNVSSNYSLPVMLIKSILHQQWCQCSKSRKSYCHFFVLLFFLVGGLFLIGILSEAFELYLHDFAYCTSATWRLNNCINEQVYSSCKVAGWCIYKQICGT